MGPEADEIRSRKLGWDVTDFGSRRFDEVGLTVFTIRNGRLDDPENRKIYAEKILIVCEAQKTPFHLHYEKTEDIINRGGGRLVVELYHFDDRNELADTPVTVSCDGVRRTVPAGGSVILSTGESITLVPGLYHEFAGEPGSGTVLVGEVSSVNDDAIDNHFLAGVAALPVDRGGRAAVAPAVHRVPVAGRLTLALCHIKLIRRRASYRRSITLDNLG